MGNVIRSLVITVLKIVLCICLFQLEHIEGCSELCTFEGDGNQTCLQVDVVGCDVANPVYHEERLTTVHLFSVDLRPATTSSNPGKLVLNWTLVSAADRLTLRVVGHDGNSTDRVRAGTRGGSHPYCVVYTLPEGYVGTNKTVLIYDSCTSVEGASVYEATLSSTESDAVTYRVQTPRNVTADHLEAACWDPVVAISVTPRSVGKADVSVVMETPDTIPSWGNIVTLRDSGTMHYSLLRHNTTQASYSVATERAYTEYYATIEVFSSACGTSGVCANVSTPRVHVIATSTSSTPETSIYTTENEVQSSPVTMAPPVIDDNSPVKYIIIGLVVGIVLVACFLVFGFMIRRCWKRRCCQNDARRDFFKFGSNPPDDMELAVKAGPTVLILYSCDCERHEQVIVELASYLKHTFYCQVAMDLWEQNDIQTRGPVSWLLDKLETCHYVIVVCSVGARLKCVRGRAALKPRIDRPVLDIFPTALDYVTEKMWLMRNEDKPLNSFIVVCFDYAGENDIPPKLDLVQRYFLPADLPQLFCHIYGLEFQANMTTRKDFEGRTALTLDQTDTGKQLLKAVASAKEFFSNNPNWLLEEIERDKKDVSSEPTEPIPVPVTNPALNQVVPPPSLYDTIPPTEGINSPDTLSQRTITSDTRPESDSVRLSLSHGGTLSSSSLASDEDAVLLEQRNRKRRLRLDRSLTDHESAPPSSSSRRKASPSPISPNKVLQDGWFSVVRHSKKLMRQLQGKPKPGYSNLSEEQPYHQQNGGAPVMENGIPNGIPHPGNPPVAPGQNGSQTVTGMDAKRAPEAVSDDEDSLCSVEQLQRDCDFIQNFDIHTFNGGGWTHNLPTKFEHLPGVMQSDQQHSCHSFTNPMCLLSPLGGSTSAINGDVPTGVVPCNGDVPTGVVPCNGDVPTGVVPCNGDICDYPVSHITDHHEGTITFA